MLYARRHIDEGDVPLADSRFLWHLHRWESFKTFHEPRSQTLAYLGCEIDRVKSLGPSEH